MKDLTVGKEHKQIINFAIPMLIGNVFQQLYNVVDSMIVGQYLGEKSLSAVGASFPIIFVLVSLVFGITSGGTIVVSQFFGAKKYDEVKRTIDTIVIIIIVSSVLISALGIIFSEDIFKFIKLPE